MRQKKNKGYKKSHKIYALTVIVLGLAIILMAMFLLFYVQKIEVKGNEYTDSQEIVDLVEEDPLAINSLYLLYKYRFTDYDMPGSLNSISVSLRAPWSKTAKEALQRGSSQVPSSASSHSHPWLSSRVASPRHSWM